MSQYEGNVYDKTDAELDEMHYKAILRRLEQVKETKGDPIRLYPTEQEFFLRLVKETRGSLSWDGERWWLNLS